MSFGRARAMNGAGLRLHADLGVLRASHAPADQEVRALVDEGEWLLGALAQVLHGDRPRGDLDDARLDRWLDTAAARCRLERWIQDPLRP